jgi:hypothetical protein
MLQLPTPPFFQIAKAIYAGRSKNQPQQSRLGEARASHRCLSLRTKVIVLIRKLYNLMYL